MPNFLSTCAAVFCLTVCGTAQNINVAESAKQPGDPLRYTITLASPPKGTISQIYVSFHLTTPEHGDQKGLPINFDLTKFSPTSSPTEYKVDDVTPNAMSGTYRLTTIQLRLQGGGIRDYSYPADFKQDNKIDIDNSAKDVFPNIKSVMPSH
jgi:hypothetical protein